MSRSLVHELSPVCQDERSGRVWSWCRNAVEQVTEYHCLATACSKRDTEPRFTILQVVQYRLNAFFLVRSQLYSLRV